MRVNIFVIPENSHTDAVVDMLGKRLSVINDVVSHIPVSVFDDTDRVVYETESILSSIDSLDVEGDVVILMRSCPGLINGSIGKIVSKLTDLEILDEYSKVSFLSMCPVEEVVECSLKGRGVIDKFEGNLNPAFTHNLVVYEDYPDNPNEFIVEHEFIRDLNGVWVDRPMNEVLEERSLLNMRRRDKFNAESIVSEPDDDGLHTFIVGSFNEVNFNMNYHELSNALAFDVIEGKFINEPLRLLDEETATAIGVASIKNDKKLVETLLNEKTTILATIEKAELRLSNQKSILCKDRNVIDLVIKVRIGGELDVFFEECQFPLFTSSFLGECTTLPETGTRSLSYNKDFIFQIRETTEDSDLGKFLRRA